MQSRLDELAEMATKMLDDLLATESRNEKRPRDTVCMDEIAPDAKRAKVAGLNYPSATTMPHSTEIERDSVPDINEGPTAILPSTDIEQVASPDINRDSTATLPSTNIDRRANTIPTSSNAYVSTNLDSGAFLSTEMDQGANTMLPSTDVHRAAFPSTNLDSGAFPSTEIGPGANTMLIDIDRDTMMLLESTDMSNFYLPAGLSSDTYVIAPLLQQVCGTSVDSVYWT